MQFKIDQIKSKPFKSRIREKKEGDYAKKLSLRFRSQQFFLCKICGEVVFSKFIETCMETPYVGAHTDGHQHGDRKPTETCVTVFCYKSVNLSVEELKNNKII